MRCIICGSPSLVSHGDDHLYCESCGSEWDETKRQLKSRIGFLEELLREIRVLISNPPEATVLDYVGNECYDWSEHIQKISDISWRSTSPPPASTSDTNKE